ncbi:hypothetical protein BC332_34710 [Capsicum chinense]|nr:hypothetical protein BC332_34710 [Capsicum chinense]
MFITSTMDWKENFIFKRKLHQEASEKLKQLPLCNRPNPVFVTEWVDDGRQIVGIGCALRTLLTVRIEPIIKPGLFVTTKDWKLLNTVLFAKGSDYKLKRFPFPLMFAANDFRVDEVMLDPSVAVKSELVKIETGTFSNARKILTVFTKDENSYRYVSVPHYWDATKQVLFELAILRQEINRGKNISNDYSLPRVTHRWFDDRLRIFKIAPPNIPIITFNLETVSSDRDRNPTGEDCDDVIFSAAVYHSHENILYSQVYLPIRGRDEESLLNEIKTMDKYPEYKNHKHLLQVFTCERDLLINLMKLLSPDANSTVLSKS